MKSHERSITPFIAAKGFLGGLFQSQCFQLLVFFSPRKVNLKISLIPEDDLPSMAKSQKTTYREWTNLGR
jgi:hypothetical protein